MLAPVPSSRRDAAVVPVLGTIAAGIPILAVENVEMYVPVPEEMAGKSSNLFALRVRGDSMTGDGILPEDLVVVRQQKVVSNGELAAVLIGEEATVKRVHIDDGQVTLISSNPLYQPIPIGPDDAQILGKVVGLIRHY